MRPCDSQRGPGGNGRGGRGRRGARHSRSAGAEESDHVEPRAGYAGPRRPGAAILSPAARWTARAEGSRGGCRQAVARPSVAAERTRMSVNATPPGWADVLLRACLTPRDSDSVSGDLLEQYREKVRPARGRRRANIWYMRQVLGF